MQIELDPTLEIGLHGSFCCFCWLSDSLPDYDLIPDCLDEYERSRISAYKNSADKWRFTAARLIVRTVLASAWGCDKSEVVLQVEQGRPYPDVQNQNPGFFSIAHSSMGILVGFSREGHIGVDIEQEKRFPNLLGVAKRIMTFDEYAIFSKLEGDEASRAFFRLWVRKEAVLKYLGTGFSLDPALVNLGMGISGKVRIDGKNRRLKVDDGFSDFNRSIYHWSTVLPESATRVRVPKFHVKLTSE